MNSTDSHLPPGLRGARFAICVLITVGICLPVLDSVGIGPALLALVAFWAAIKLGIPSRIPSAWPIRFTFYCLAAFGAVIGFGNRNFFYDATLLVLALPILFVIGYQVSGVEKLRITLCRTLLLLVVVASLIGIYEYLSGSYVLNIAHYFDTPERNGHLRARGLFPQPLILALFAAALLPIAASRRIVPRLDLRLVLILILLTGVFISGSRGIPAVVIATVIITGVSKLDGTPALRRLAAFSTVVVAFGVLLYSSGNPFVGGGRSAINSLDPDTASAEYRAELYRQIIPVVLQNPLGSGFGGVRQGIILIESRLYGQLDAARTIDSEIVLMALKFGFLGIAAYLLLWSVVLRANIQCESPESAASIMMMLAGMFVALQAWLSVVCVLALLFGCAVGIPLRQSGSGDRELRMGHGAEY